MLCMMLVMAALTYGLYAMHSLVTVWCIISHEQCVYWQLTISLLVMAAEGSLLQKR